MSQTSESSPTREQRLEQVLEAWYRAVEAGQPPDAEELIRQHPDLAGELRSFLTDKKLFEAAAVPLMPPSPAPPCDPNALTLAPSTEASPSLGRIRYVGDYELLEEIGRGGMGVIYRARQVSLNRTVAVKMIPEQQLPSEADRQRFQREAEAVASLDHPNILPLYEVGVHEGQPYFSMKLVEGGSLAAEGTRPTADRKSRHQRAARLIATVARAVHHSHQRGILHRDLKPSNILLDADGTPYVADFGLARLLDPTPDASLTQSGAVVGTPSYMAPEQAGGQKGLTTAADVYGLGAILYELLTGQPPHRAESPLDTLLQVLQREPPAPRSLDKTLPRDLETICLKCLHKEVGKRYESAAALADDLERWLRGEPILARRIRWPGRLWRWCRRNPLLAIETGVALVGILAALGFLTTLVVRDAQDKYRFSIPAAEGLRRQGWREDARRALRKGITFRFAIGPDWRGEAIQIAATPSLLPRRQIRVQEKKSQDAHQVGVEWLDTDQVRIVTPAAVRVWKVSTGERVEKGPGRKPTPVPLADLPPGARVLGRSPGDGWAVLRLPRRAPVVDAPGPPAEDIVLWNVREKRIARTLPDVGPVPGFMAVSPDGRRLAWVDPLARATVRLWDWELDRFLAVLVTPREIPLNNDDFDNAFRFSPDGELLTTREQPHQSLFPDILVWHAETGQLLSRLRQVGGPCTWSPDGKILTTTTSSLGSGVFPETPGGAYGGPHVQFWELRYPSRSYAVPEGDGLTLSPTDQHLAVGNRFWKLADRGDDRALERIPGPLRGQAICAADGSLQVIRIDRDKDTWRQTLHLQRLEPLPMEKSILLPETIAPAGGMGLFRQVHSATPAADGRHVLLALERVELRPRTGKQPSLVSSGDYRLEWWDVDQGRRLAVWNEDSEEHQLHRVALAGEGRFAVTTSREHIRVWNVATGEVEQDWPNTFQGGVIFTPDRRHLARYRMWEARQDKDGIKGISDIYTVLDIHEVSTGRLVRHLELRDGSSGRRACPLALHLESGWLAAGLRRQLQLWNLDTGKVWAFWSPHDYDGFSADFSHDGQLLM